MHIQAEFHFCLFIFHDKCECKILEQCVQMKQERMWKMGKIGQYHCLDDMASPGYKFCLYEIYWIMYRLPWILFFVRSEAIQQWYSWVTKSHMKIMGTSNKKSVFMLLQYIPRNMHTVFALLCFVVVIHWLIFPYPSGLLHWHCGNLTIAPVPAKQPWWIWINTSCEFIMNDCITTTKQSTTKPCAYFLGYTVYVMNT